MPPPRSPFDLSDSDEEWTIFELLLSRVEKRGRPPKRPALRVADAVFYLLGSGCSWRILSRKYPTAGRQPATISAGGGSTDGSGERMTDSREEVRQTEGCNRDPSAAVIDSRVVQTTRVGDPDGGYDGALSVSPDASVGRPSSECFDYLLE
jgi:hypothetical protein